MSIFNQFPWTNYREYNLDWVIKTVSSALADLSSTVSTYFSDHVDNTLTVTGDAADAKKTGDEITSLKNRMTTAEGTLSTLSGYEYHQVVLRYNGVTWSYAKGDYDAADKVLKGVVGSDPTLDNVGSVWYQPSLTGPAYALVTCKLNTSYLPVAAWDLQFYVGSGTETSVTIKSDGTFV